MTRPTALPPPRYQRSAVILGVVPSSDGIFDVEIQRKTTDSGSSFATVTTLPSATLHGQQYAWTDLWAKDQARTYSYRGRQVAAGYYPGDWTPTVSAKPLPLPLQPVNIVPLSAKGIGADVWMSTAAKVKFGTGAAPTYLTKRAMVKGTAITRESTSVGNFNVGNGVALPAAAGSTCVGWLDLEVPPGVTLTLFSAEMFRKNSGDKATAVFYKYVAGGSLSTALATITATVAIGSTYTVYNSSTQSLTASSDGYAVKVTLNGSTLRTNAAFARAWATYRKANLHTGP